MKERGFMNLITLNVKLCTENENNDILLFRFDDGDGKVHLNTDSCQAEMKEVFSRLIRLLIENDVTLMLTIDDDYGRNLYKEVCSEYISDLQKEIDSVKSLIRNEFS